MCTETCSCYTVQKESLQRFSALGSTTELIWRQSEIGVCSCGASMKMFIWPHYSYSCTALGTTSVAQVLVQAALANKVCDGKEAALQLLASRLPFRGSETFSLHLTEKIKMWRLVCPFSKAKLQLVYPKKRGNVFQPNSP